MTQILMVTRAVLALVPCLLQATTPEPRIRFANAGKQHLRILWVPSDGGSRLVSELGPGELTQMSTSVGHTFEVVADGIAPERILVQGIAKASCQAGDLEIRCWCAGAAQCMSSQPPGVAFLHAFADDQIFFKHAGPGFCAAPQKDVSCNTISHSILPPSSAVLKSMPWPEIFPFDDLMLHRDDSSDDAFFYEKPNFGIHIGDAPRAALESFYADVFASLGSVSLHVDLCASWMSHLPDDYSPRELIGLGMNRQEMEKNERLTEIVLQDLNKLPFLPFSDRSVDVYTSAMSVDYLIRPLDLFREMRRSLRPGGVAIMSFSNRFWESKVIGVWQTSSEVARCALVMSYFRYAGFENAVAYDVSTGSRREPLYIVMGWAPSARERFDEL